MPRVRSPERNKAKDIYIKAKGNIKLIDIAAELKVLDTQIRKWKSQDKWDDILKGTLPKRNRNEKERKETQKEQLKDTISIEVKEVMKNEELTEKQRKFCVVYSRCLNATKAYQKVYECGYESAMVNGCILLRNHKIREQIDKLNAVQFDKEFIKKSVLQKYIDIALSNITEYLDFGNKEIETDKGTFTVSYVDIKNSSEVDGTLITEISQGKEGIKVKLADKMKAMEFLNKYSNLLNDEEKTKLELENKRLQNEKLAKEIKGNGDINKEPVRIVDDI